MHTTFFHLVRHGENDVLKHSLAGRAPGVHLNDLGAQQAEAIASMLRRESIHRIVSSSLERARETAAPLSRLLGIEVEINDAFLEVDFAEWTGKTFEELDAMETWRKWNTFRSGSRVPGGESMVEVQARVVDGIENLRRESPGRGIAIFSHGDAIRAAATYFLGMPLDHILRLQVSPGSVSTLVISDWSAQLRCWNVVPGSL